MIPDPVHRARTVAVALAAALAAVAFRSAHAAEPYQEISVDQVASHLGQPGFHVLDANGPEKYAKAHVPGARLVDFKRFSEADLPADRNATLVFYCANTH